MGKFGLTREGEAMMSAEEWQEYCMEQQDHNSIRLICLGCLEAYARQEVARRVEGDAAILGETTG